MRSPLSPIPSLKSRRRNTPPADILLAIPRLSPERELEVIQALIKPQTGLKLRQRLAAGDTGEQPWPDDAADRTADVRNFAASRLGYDLLLHLPGAGEYRLLATLPSVNQPEAHALAVLLSRRFPRTWIVVGRLFVRDGQFYRRHRRVKLSLRPAADVHLSRILRAAVRTADTRAS